MKITKRQSGNQTDVKLRHLKPEVISKRGRKNPNSYWLSMPSDEYLRYCASNFPKIDELRELLKRRPCETLSSRGYACIGFFYGLTDAECTDEIRNTYGTFDGRGHSFKEIGRIVHLSPERVRLLMIKTLQRCQNEKRWVAVTEAQTEPTETTATDNVKSSIAVAMVPGIQL